MLILTFRKSMLLFFAEAWLKRAHAGKCGIHWRAGLVRSRGIYLQLSWCLSRQRYSLNGKSQHAHTHIPLSSYSCFLSLVQYSPYSRVWLRRAKAILGIKSKHIYVYIYMTMYMNIYDNICMNTSNSHSQWYSKFWYLLILESGEMQKIASPRQKSNRIF